MGRVFKSTPLPAGHESSGASYTSCYLPLCEREGHIRTSRELEAGDGAQLPHHQLAVYARGGHETLRQGRRRLHRHAGDAVVVCAVGVTVGARREEGRCVGMRRVLEARPCTPPSMHSAPSPCAATHVLIFLTLEAEAEPPLPPAPPEVPLLALFSNMRMRSRNECAPLLAACGLAWSASRSKNRANSL